MESCHWGHTGVLVNFRKGILTSIRWLKFFDKIFNNDHAYTTPGATYQFLKTGLSSCVGLEVEVMINIYGGRNCSTSENIRNENKSSPQKFSLFFNSEIILKQLFASGSVNIHHYYSTIAPFYHICSRESAKYETVIHCRVPVWPV